MDRASDRRQRPNAILENRSPISLDETTTCIGVERFGPVAVDQDGHRRSEFLGYENGTYTDRWVLKQLECLVGRSGVITELSGDRLFFVDCAPDGMRIDGTDTVCR